MNTTPVTADDVDAVIDAAVTALDAHTGMDWNASAANSDWTCWEAVEHTADSLLYYAMQLVPYRPSLGVGYPFLYHAPRDGGPEGITFAHPDGGKPGLLRMFNGCGGLLATMVRATPPTHRARHMWGHPDPAGFAAMGIVEIVVHIDDVIRGLGAGWSPDADVCARTVARLFPDAPLDTDPLQTLLWATGRADLSGLERLTDDWRWYAAPADER